MEEESAEKQILLMAIRWRRGCEHETESFPHEARSQLPQAGTQNVAQNSHVEVAAGGDGDV